MNFKSRISFPNQTPPTKLYIHNAGIELYFRNKEIEYISKDSAAYLIQVLDKYKIDFSQYTFLLASMWAKGNHFDDLHKERIIDFAGFSDIKDENWSRGNPDVRFWVVKNGIYVQEGMTCGDSVLAFGAEEEIRRNTNTLEDFMKAWPMLGIPEQVLEV